MNISFHKPKKDRCDQCHIYDTNIGTLSEEEKQKHGEHLKRKQKARDIKDEDKADAIKSNGKIVMACFDFQKILNCPQGNVGLFYYKRKLSVLNFTVFDLARLEAYCYMWPEVNGKHGACEVCSCLLKFIEDKVHNGAKEFRFWSDNCAGQNRNRIVFSFFTYAARKFGVTITHRFLERGHTQNEADSVHALIERTVQNKLIFTPEQWYALVRWAKVVSPYYNVIEMSLTDFYNFKILLVGKNWAKNTKKEKVCWTKIKEISVSHENSNIVNYRYDFENEEVMTLIIGRTHSSRRTQQSNEDNLIQCYTNHLPVSVAKYNDLLSLCKSRIIPQEYHNFYKNLPKTHDDPDSSLSSSE